MLRATVPLWLRDILTCCNNVTVNQTYYTIRRATIKGGAGIK